MNRLRGGVPIPQHNRYTRVNDPALRGLVPALSVPRENGNQTVNKVAGLLNRAGSSPRNPVLAGLGAHLEFMIDERDRLISVFLYRDRREPGPDLMDDVVTLGDNLFGLDFLMGSGTSVAGSPLTGAVRNFLRILSRAGATERVFWVQTFDKDIVTVEGQNALDDALEPVEIVATIVDVSRDWIDLKIDFMVSWSDEFSVLHNRNADDRENGNLKSYGGAKFVSFFQTGELENVPLDSTEVNVVDQNVISNQHTLQVENTVGLKHVTVRFRSKMDSAYFVDVDVLIRVVAPEEGVCAAPASEPCVDLYLKKDSILPAETPNEPSVVGVPTVAGTPGDPVSVDLLIITLRGATAGAAPKLRVRKWGWVASADAMAGARLTQVGVDLDYSPLVLASTSPLTSPPYTGGKRYTIALAKTDLTADNVALMDVMVLDGDHVSNPVNIPGPSARALQFFPIGGTGGGPTCAY